MDTRKLKKKLRTELALYWRPYAMKNKCENCGSSENLELHHIDFFNSFFYEHNLDEDKKDYTEEEVEKIKLLCIGYHFKYVRHKTLCSDCHVEEHREEIRRTSYNARLKIDDEKFLEIENIRDRMLVKTFYLNNIRVEILRCLTKIDLDKLDLLNKEELEEYSKDFKPTQKIFGSRQSGISSMTTRRMQQIIKSYNYLKE